MLCVLFCKLLKTRCSVSTQPLQPVYRASPPAARHWEAPGEAPWNSRVLVGK